MPLIDIKWERCIDLSYHLTIYMFDVYYIVLVYKFIHDKIQRSFCKNSLYQSM